VLSRSNNILMARVREAEYREVDARRRSGVLKGTMFVHLKKDLDVAPVNWIGAPPVAGAPPITQTTDYGVQRDVQHALANVRTDLDSFSDTEAYALMLSGYRMTAVEMSARCRGWRSRNRQAGAAGSRTPRTCRGGFWRWKMPFATSAATRRRTPT